MDEIKEKKIKKEKKKKRKVEIEIGPVETLEAASEKKKISDDSMDEIKEKKRKVEICTSETPEEATVSPSPEKKKKRKKKQNETEKEDRDNETPEPENKKKKKNKKKRKSDESPEATSTASPKSKNISEDNDDSMKGASTEKKKKRKANEDEEDPGALENFRISAPIKAKLMSTGIKALSQIQRMTFNHVVDGFDLVARAPTGQEKTLAYVLPILESLTNAPAKGSVRTPTVLVLLPTRDLVDQVAADFDLYGKSLKLITCCLYGESPYSDQKVALKSGVDIVIGNPGRIKELFLRGNLDFGSLKFCVLDEANEMLDKGFRNDAEFILGKVKDLKTIQTLLFSATLPRWFQNITNRFLKPDKKIVDLDGKEEVKAIVNARHTVIPCPTEVLVTGIPDEIHSYGRSDTIKSLLMKWTSFEEVQNIVGPYVSQVIRKAQYGGYKSAREVFEDYKIFHSIRSKLVKGKKKLLIPINVSKYCYRYAVKEKALMLSGFSTMLSDAHIKKHHVGWIRQQLKEDDPKELILIAEIAIRNMDAWVKEMDKDVQSEISEQKKEKLMWLEKFRNEFEKIIQNEFQAGDIDKMVLEFEKLKWKVSCEKEHMETLAEGLDPLLDAYYNTLENVGNRLTRNKLEGEFKKLLSDEDSEGDLAKEWSEVARGMLKLDLLGFYVKELL